jgi:hypothetical protein
MSARLCLQTWLHEAQGVRKSNQQKKRKAAPLSQSDLAGTTKISFRAVI